jgi:hypothetical protein
MGFSNEPLRLVLKQKSKKAVKVSMIVNPTDVTKTKGVLNYDAKKTIASNQNKIQNLSLEIAKQKVDEMLMKEQEENTSFSREKYENIYNSQSLNNTKCFDFKKAAFSGSMALYNGGMSWAMGAALSTAINPYAIGISLLAPTVNCLANKYISKLMS